MAPSHSETGRPALRCQERRSHFPLALIPLSVVAMMTPDEHGCDGGLSEMSTVKHVFDVFGGEHLLWRVLADYAPMIGDRNISRFLL